MILFPSFDIITNNSATQQFIVSFYLMLKLRTQKDKKDPAEQQNIHLTYHLVPCLHQIYCVFQTDISEGGFS